jgi:hypothetical protein
MNLSTTADISNSRAFNDEVGYNPTRNTFASVLLRVAGTFGGGLAITTLLAIVVHH